MECACVARPDWQSSSLARPLAARTRRSRRRRGERIPEFQRWRTAAPGPGRSSGTDPAHHRDAGRAADGHRSGTRPGRSRHRDPGRGGRLPPDAGGGALAGLDARGDTRPRAQPRRPSRPVHAGDGPPRAPGTRRRERRRAACPLSSPLVSRRRVPGARRRRSRARAGRLPDVGRSTDPDHARPVAPRCGSKRAAPDRPRARLGRGGAERGRAAARAGLRSRARLAPSDTRRSSRRQWTFADEPVTALATLAERVLATTDTTYRSLMDAIARAEVGLGWTDVRGRDLPRLLRWEERRAVPSASLATASARTTFATIGMDLDAIRGLALDEQERPGKDARALTIPVGVPGDVRVSFVATDATVGICAASSASSAPRRTTRRCAVRRSSSGGSARSPSPRGRTSSATWPGSRPGWPIASAERRRGSRRWCGRPRRGVSTGRACSRRTCSTSMARAAAGRAQREHLPRDPRAGPAARRPTTTSCSSSWPTATRCWRAQTSSAPCCSRRTRPDTSRSAPAARGGDRGESGPWLAAQFAEGSRRAPLELARIPGSRTERHRRSRRLDARARGGDRAAAALNGPAVQGRSASFVLDGARWRPARAGLARSSSSIRYFGPSGSSYWPLFTDQRKKSHAATPSASERTISPIRSTTAPGASSRPRTGRRRPSPPPRRWGAGHRRPRAGWRPRCRRTPRRRSAG